MDERTIGRLATIIQDKVCAVCIDRNPDGSCDRLAEGSCTLMAKLPQAAEAILRINSDRIEPYIESLRAVVCTQCDLRNPDGSCDVRITDRCMLDSYLPLVVEAMEEFFQKSFPVSDPSLVRVQTT